MKRAIAILLASLMLISVLCACGSSAAPATEPTAQAKTETAPAKAEEPKTEKEEKAPQTAEAPEAEKTEEPEELGDYELSFFTTSAEDSTLGAALRTYLESIEEATDGHVRVTWERVMEGVHMLVDSGNFGIGHFNFNVLRRNAQYSYATNDSYKAAFGYKALLLPEVVTLPLQGFDNGVASTQVLWDLYEENPEYASLLEEDYKILQLYVSTPLMYVTQGRAPDSEYFEPARDVGGTATVNVLCLNRSVWEKLPKAYQEAIDAISGREASLTMAELLKEQRDQTAQEWSVSLPEDFMIYQYTLLDPADKDYAQYQTYFDDYTAAWVKEITEDTGVNAAAFLDRALELYKTY